MFVSPNLNSKEVGRWFTPISNPQQMGYVEFMIKLYKEKDDFKGGRFTKYLMALKEGDEINIFGPFGKHIYKGKGEFARHKL